jgi:hypothetical protein
VAEVNDLLTVQSNEAMMKDMGSCRKKWRKGAMPQLPCKGVHSASKN